MNRHLSSDQFDNCIAGRPSSAELQHIAECPECAAELDRFRSTLRAFRHAVRNRVDDRLASRTSELAPLNTVQSGIPIWRWALVSAAFVVLVTFPFFVNDFKPQRIGGQTAEEISADEIMNRVNLHLSRVVPGPLEPIILLLPSDESITTGEEKQ